MCVCVCVCRSTHRNQTHPLEVMFILDSCWCSDPESRSGSGPAQARLAAGQRQTVCRMLKATLASTCGSALYCGQCRQEMEI